MKIPVAFLLITISCYFDKSTARDDCKKELFQVQETLPSYLVKFCLLDLTQSSEDAVKKLKDLFCKYQQENYSNNMDLLEDVLTHLKEVMKKLGCFPDQILGADCSVEKLGETAGDVTKNLLYSIYSIVFKIPISEVFMNAECPLLSILQV
ncbi:hypothetical protein FKM82_012337 [Ascaphus truei]